MKPKQIIIIRKDLNMTKGKLVAQGAHASLLAFLKADEKIKEEWLNDDYTKITLGVKSEAKLLSVFNIAVLKGLPVVLIRDQGYTEFPEPCNTCVGIGPVYPDELKGVTDKLQTLKD